MNCLESFSHCSPSHIILSVHRFRPAMLLQWVCSQPSHCAVLEDTLADCVRRFHRVPLDGMFPQWFALPWFLHLVRSELWGGSLILGVRAGSVTLRSLRPKPSIPGQQTRLACGLSAHPAKTCPALRRAILFAARTILRPAAPAADSRPSAFSMVEVADLPTVSDFTSTDPTVSFVDDEEELDSDF